MAKSDLVTQLTNDNVTDPVLAWTYVVSRIRVDGRPPVDMVEQVAFAFQELYRTKLVVNGAVIPEIARRFKHAGFPLDIVRANSGVLQVTIFTEGVNYVVYEDTSMIKTLVARFIHQHVPNRWLRRFWLWCLSKHK